MSEQSPKPDVSASSGGQSQKKLSTQPYKGTRDFYPDDMEFREWMFSKLQSVVHGFGYRRYDGPMLESFDLYAAKTGEEIVNQQLYWMIDRGERKLAVRPEMTPTLARMVAGKLNELPRPIRWYSLPNLWRYERPQRGRLREHWQLNVDVLGGDPTLADAEILTIAHQILRAFGPVHGIVKVNSRRLVDQFFTESLKMSPQNALAVTKAVDASAKIGESKYQTWLDDLGITSDQKNKIETFFQSNFETIKKEFPGQGAQELEECFELLRLSGLQEGKDFCFDPSVLRGMDYYTGTVFEVYDTSPENNRAMFGGGRYDNLIGLFGNQALSGVGFGMGDVTLENYIRTHQLNQAPMPHLDVMIAVSDSAGRKTCAEVSQRLRENGVRVATSLSEGKLAAQLKSADRLGARFCLLIGKEELESGALSVKELKTGKQESVKVSEIEAWFQQRSIHSSKESS